MGDAVRRGVGGGGSGGFVEAVVKDEIVGARGVVGCGDVDGEHALGDDVAIVGFDNWLVMTEAARPPLTSIDMNLPALGREAGERLLAMISGERETGTRRLPATLVVRQSTVES